MYNKPFKEELAAYRRQKVKQINDPGNLGPGTRRRFCNPFHHFKPPEGPSNERGDATIPTPIKPVSTTKPSAKANRPLEPALSFAQVFYSQNRALRC
jgi:hypothetical protein